MNSSMLWNRTTIKDKLSLSTFFPIVAMLIALLIGGLAGKFGPHALIVILGALAMTIIVLLRWDAIAVTVIIAVHLYIDWYWGLHLVALLMGLVLLLFFFMARSSQYLWVKPRALWLWSVFLIITIYPAIRGGKFMLYDAASFYPSNIFGALLMFWLGSIIARDYIHVRKFLNFLAVLGALLAIHTIIQAKTGIALFSSARIDANLQIYTANYQLAGSNVDRASSFFADPNWNGTFFATIFFLPLGLFFESASLLKKVMYLAELALILPALLFTYSAGAWIGISAGMIAFIVFIGCTRYRILLAFFIAIVVGVMMVLFPVQIALLFQHASGVNELSLRIAAWQTALRVIQAFPLTGVGLGYQAYLLRSEPYRVPAQFVPLAHPHNSYLEWAAMAGIPVLLVFLALLVYALWLAWHNWLLLDERGRSLLGGGIAAIIALSVNSVSINGWTLPPLAAIGWVILGVLSSPLLAKYLQCRTAQDKSTAMMSQAS